MKEVMIMNMDFKRKLTIPMEIKEQFPSSANMRRIKEERDREILDIFTGRSDKILLIIGPCSADNEDSVLDYVNRLAPVQEKVKDHILIIRISLILRAGRTCSRASLPPEICICGSFRTPA